MLSAILTLIERAILEIVNAYAPEEVSAQDLRRLLRSCGFRRTAPALVFTMMSLEDKGLVTCREDVQVIEGIEVRHRSYRARKGVEWRDAQ